MNYKCTDCGGYIKLMGTMPLIKWYKCLDCNKRFNDYIVKQLPEPRRCNDVVLSTVGR